MQPHPQCNGKRESVQRVVKATTRQGSKSRLPAPHRHNPKMKKAGHFAATQNSSASVESDGRWRLPTSGRRDSARK